MGLLKVLLFLTLISISTGEIFRAEITRDIGINIIDIFISITAIYGFALWIRKKINTPKYFKYFVFFILIGLLSLLINSKNLSLNQTFISILYPLRLLFLFSILPLISMQDKKFKQLLEKILLVDGIVIVLLGFLQFFFYPSLRNLMYLGWDEHLYRLFSVFLDPNFTGIFLVVFIFFLIPKLLISLSGKLNEKIFYISLIIASILALILTYSRGSFLAFVFTIILFVFISKKKYVLPLILLILLVFIILLNTVRNEGTDLFRTVSIKARISSSAYALSVISKHPIFGIGLNSYRYTLEKNNVSQTPSLYNFPSHGSSAPDNSLLFVLVTTGVLGFIFYLKFWMGVIKNKLYKKNKIQNKAIIVSIVALFIASFFVNALFYTPVMLWFFSMLGANEST